MAASFWSGCSTRCWSPALGIVLATILGFLVGIARLSPNWLVARLAGGYVELIRNLPLLFQILFWYLAVLGTLPGPRQSLISIFGEVFLNNRGIIVPAPRLRPTAPAIVVGGVRRGRFGRGLSRSGRGWARRRQMATGQQFPVGWTALGLIVGLPLIAMVATGFPITFERPELRGFNFVGGMRVIPEFVALLVALVPIPRPSSPRSCAPAFWRSRAARPRPRSRSGCGGADAAPGRHAAGAARDHARR